MAKKKKAKWPYKFVTPHGLEEFNNMDEDELIKKVLQYDTNAKAEAKNKKNSQALKDARASVNEHRKHYENTSEDWAKAKGAFDAQKEIRDNEIFDAIEEKSALESGFNDSIKNFTEHRDVAMKVLKERQRLKK